MWTKTFLQRIENLAPQNIKETLELRFFGLTKIPLLFLVSPSVLQLNDHRCAVRVPLNKMTRNHLGSMYFGALSMGADCAGGLLAMHYIQKSRKKISLVFKDFHADFLKRPEEAVIFTCDDGPAIGDLVQTVSQSDQRHNLPIHISAWLESQPTQDPVAKFILTLSLKKK